MEYIYVHPMICTRQPKFLENKPLKIASVWEVRLDLPVWHRIASTAKEKRITKSWIVRYCVFKFCHTFVGAHQQRSITQQRYCNDKPSAHRHRLCLYGEDELILRNTAFMLGITVSSLIRMALEENLNLVEKGEVSDQLLFEQGIKFTERIAYSQEFHLDRPSENHFRQLGFFPAMWWKSTYLKHDLKFLSTIIFSTG